uniref:Uncharacterized protein n=1 Tax=Brassica oleracea var. oleracea TaxID=109376 RepID=A0A0D2ZZ09_BRAOL
MVPAHSLSGPTIPPAVNQPAPVHSLPPPTRHPMTTRSRDGTRKQKSVLSLHTTVSPIPNTHLQALKDPNWNPAMTVEYDALIKNETFKLVPKPPDTNI